MSMYIVWPSVLSVINLKIHKTKAIKNNRPRSIHQYSNTAPTISGQTFIFGVVSFVSKSLFVIERENLQFTILTQKPQSHVRILIY